MTAFRSRRKRICTSWPNGARTRAGLAAYLSSTPASQLAAQFANSHIPPEVDANDWREWQERFGAHLRCYGHAIYDLDFSNPVPADDPVPLLETCQLFIGKPEVNPHKRQLEAIHRRELAQQSILSRLKGAALKGLPQVFEHGAEIRAAAGRWAGRYRPGLSAAAPAAARVGTPLCRCGYGGEGR